MLNLVVFQDRKRCKKGTFGHIAEPEGEDVSELAQGNTAMSTGKMLILLAQWMGFCGNWKPGRSPIHLLQELKV